MIVRLGTDLIISWENKAYHMQSIKDRQMFLTQ